jgi:hypothetical protein
MMPPIYVAIDFGTTYSGIAYTDPSDPDGVPRILTKWNTYATAEKVQTVFYEHRSELLWGDNVPDSVRGTPGYFRLFKLALDAENDKLDTETNLSRHYATKDDEVAKMGFGNAKYATEGYFRAMKKHLDEHLTMQYGQEIDRSQIKWVLTFPAVWSTKAEKCTKEAAVSAGMGCADDLIIITEPEAAAAYAFTLRPDLFKVGELVMICDAGGGTVDVVTHEIMAVTPKLETRMVGSADGAQCGSTFLDKGFEKQVRDQFGPVTKKYREKTENAIKQCVPRSETTTNRNTISQRMENHKAPIMSSKPLDLGTALRNQS